MKRSGHLNPSEETGMEGHLQTSMEEWVDNNKSLLPYMTASIPNTPTQHGYKTQHSTVTARHTLKNTVAKEFNQMAPPARTITVALDMGKAFDTIHIHTLIRKLRHTKIPGTMLLLFVQSLLHLRYWAGCSFSTLLVPCS